MRKGIWKIMCTFTIVTIIFTLIMTSSMILFANPTTTVSIKPPSIIDTTLIPGKTFVINASVTDVVDLYTWQVKIYFDINVINATDAYYPPDHVFAGKTYIPVTPVIDQDADGWYVTYGCTLMGTATAFSGNGTLCQIQFIIKSIGSSKLQFSTYGGFTYLLDSNGEIIDASLQDGYFRNKPPPSPATLYVDPPKIIDPMLTPSKNFSINIRISSATELYGFQLKISFNPNILNALEAKLGDFFPPEITPFQEINNTAGYVQFSATLKPPEPPKSGNGTLAIIVFHVENIGASTLDLYETSLVNQLGEALPHNAFDGYFNNILLAKLYVDPPEIIDPTMLPSSTFTINITIDDIENLRVSEFNLTYDTNVLTWLTIDARKVLNQTPSAKIFADDEAGYIWAKLTYPASITTYSPIALISIKFHVDAIGASPLDLHDTRLLDHAGQPISHEAIDGFFSTLIRDVAVTNVVPSRSWAYQGWTVNITVTVKNEGNISETFDVKTYYDTNLIGTITVFNLAPNNEMNLTFTWNTAGVPEGNYTIKAEASTVPYEFDVIDNVFIDSTVWIMTLIRDVAVTNVVPSRSWAYQGWTVNITVTVKNEGNVGETFDVKTYYDINLIGTYHIVDLAPSGEINLTFTWNTAGVTPCHNYTIKGEATAVPFEFNTTNNIFVDGVIKVRFMGDVNGDGKIDMRDLAELARAFGSYPGHPKWNPDFDLDRDGWITMRDLSMVARLFGKECES